MSGSIIIGGDFKRAKIPSVPPELLVRPILARIKKSLFDILYDRLEGCRFLDLFAGSGSVGLEALSRGAEKTVFVDVNPRCQRFIQDTIRRIAEKHPDADLPNRAQVCRADVTKGLAWLRQEFDLVFCGAPYVDAKKNDLFFVERVLDIVKRDGLIAPEGWLIAQHRNKETFQVPPGWTCFRQEEYGDSILSFFKPC